MEPPSTVRVIEEMGGITISVPLRASGLARHLLEKLSHAGLVLLLLTFMLARVVDIARSQNVAVIVAVALAGIGLLGFWLRNYLSDGKRESIRLTPQRIIFSDGDVLLEEVGRMRLSVDRGSLILQTPAGPRATLRGLNYAELVWLRATFQEHIARRQATTGPAQAQSGEVPQALQALRER